MYLINTIQKNEIKEQMNLFLLERSFSIEELGQANKIEVHGTSFQDAGPDYCEFVLFKDDGSTIKRRQEGY
jgi:hypothetical protein